MDRYSSASCILVAVGCCLFTRPATAQGCNSPYTYPIVGDIVSYKTSPDGARVVFQGDVLNDGIFDLYSAPADGSGPVVKLNVPNVQGSFGVGGYEISPDSARVVYRADYPVAGQASLFCVPIGGGVSTKIYDKPADAVLLAWVITADGTRVVYGQRDGGSEGPEHLYVIPITGGSPMRLTSDYGSGGTTLTWRLSPDSSYVVFSAIYESDPNGENAPSNLFACPVDGSTPPVMLNPVLPQDGSIWTDFVASPDGLTVLYRCELGGQSPVYELYSVPVVGGPSTKLNITPVGGGDVEQDPVFLSDGTVVFRADLEVNNRFELWAGPADGSTAAVRITNALLTQSVEPIFIFTAAEDRVIYRGGSNPSRLFSTLMDGSQTTVELSGTLVPDGEVEKEISIGSGDRVVYLADQEENNRFELYSVPADGSAAALKLHPTLASSDDVGQQYSLTPEGTYVFYRATGNGYSVPIDGSAAPIQLNSAGTVIMSNKAGMAMGRFVWRGILTTYVGNDVEEIFIASADGSEAARKLNGHLVTGPIDGDVTSFQISADGTRAIYTAAMNSGVGLYSALVQATPCAIQIANQPAFVTLSEATIRADGLVIAFKAQEDLHGPFSIYVVPSDGGSTTMISGTPSVSVNIGPPVFTPDGSRVIFRRRETNAWELYSAPVDGSGPVNLSGTILAGEIQAFQVSPDSSRVVYWGDLDTDNIEELYSAPVDGSSAAVKISGPGTVGPGVVLDDWTFSPDGNRVLYLAAQDSNRFELYSAPVDGSSPSVRLNSPVPSLGGVAEIQHMRFSSDGQYVYYLAFEQVSFRQDLFRVPIDGSSPSVRLNGPLVNGGNVGGVAVFPADDTQVVYVADGLVDGRGELFLVATDGSQSPVQVNQPIPTFADFWLPEIDGTGQWIIAGGTLHTAGVQEVYRVKMDGSVQERINPPVIARGDLAFRLSPDRNTVLMYGDAFLQGVSELLAAPADGDGTWYRLSEELVQGGQVQSSYVVTADSSWAVYHSDQELDDVFELFLVPLDGSESAQRLSYSFSRRVRLKAKDGALSPW